MNRRSSFNLVGLQPLPVATLMLVAFLACTATTAFAQPLEANRVLRLFDFEERRLGNAEQVPMHWNKVEGSGLPHYVEGRLATDRARSGTHSFRLSLDGGSVAYRYDVGQLKVRPDAHYRVEGYVQTTVLSHARARISAYLTDLDGHPLPGSTRHSIAYAAATEAQTSDWQPLELELSADTPGAAYLVVELALLQPALYAPSALGDRALYPQDIHGSAWFDDVVVSQVPRVSLATARPGNIFLRSDPLRLSVTVNDRFTEDLSGTLVLRDAVGRTVHQRSGAFDAAGAETLGPGRKRVVVDLPDSLTPGWYVATLEMSSQGQFVGKQSLEFVRLADDGARAAVPDPRFGVVATDIPFEGWADLPAILSLMSAGRVKLGVWTELGDVNRDAPREFEELLEGLRELRIVPTACLLAPPPGVMQGVRQSVWSGEDSFPLAVSEAPSLTRLGASARNPWVELLKAPPPTWQPQLADLIARHATYLDKWQLGDDGTDAFVTQPAMREVYRVVYTEFAKLLGHPDLAMPWPAWYELNGALPATVALHLKPDVLPSQIPLYVQDIQRSALNGPSGTTPPQLAEPETTLSIYLEPLDRARYGREAQIQDLARRLAYSVMTDARRIDVRLPFSVEAPSPGTDGQMEKRPDELLIVVRTIMTTLGNATFKGKVPIADGIEAFLFDRAGQGILMLWDRGNDASTVRRLPVNLGTRARRLDLWGNTAPLFRTKQPGAAAMISTEGESVALELGPMPIFLLDIDGQVAQFRASVALDNDRVESSFKPHTRRLRFTNPYQTSISGSVKLSPPRGWTINPPTFAFNLNPGETFDREVSIEFPYNSFAGPKTIEARFQVQADTAAEFAVPIVVHLGLSDVGLQTIALRDGNDVVVQQMITNYGEKPIDYTSFAMYPGQARQERLVTNLAPGRTTIKKYRFTGVKFSEGARVRSGLKELVGNRILNDEAPIQ